MTPNFPIRVNLRSSAAQEGYSAETFPSSKGLYLVTSMFFFRTLPILLFLSLPSYAALFGTVTTDLGAADLILDQARNKLYVVNSNLSRVDVFSTTTRKFLSPITVGSLPLAGAMSPDGKFLYVTAYNPGALDVIDLDKAALIQAVALPAKPEGVAVGIDGRVLVSTIGTGMNNAFDTLLIYDPSASQSKQLVPIPITVTGPAAPVTPPLGLTALSTRSAMLTSQDGSIIVGVNNISTTSRSVFVYDVLGQQLLNARTITGISDVVSIAPDTSRFMAGLTLFETQTLSVLAQQNAANAPFSFPSSTATNFNTQQNQGGSVFAPDGSVIYSAFNIAPIQNPAAKANSSQLLLNDPDNLLINLGLQLPENLTGKMVITSDGGTIYGLSESGFVTLPIATMSQSPIAVPASTVTLLSNDQCGVSPNNQVAVSVTNVGKGRMTASAQLLSLPAATTAGLGGFGGPGGGGPGGGITVFLPPALLGRGGPAGVTAAAGFGNTNTAVLQTSPLLSTQQNGEGANFTFGYNSINAKTVGTVTPHNFLIQSPEAINIPGNVQVFQNNHDSDARSKIMAMPVNASSAEGLFDMVTDTARRRLYIANSGLNRVEVFDMASQQFLPPIKVGQLPHSLAIGTDGVTLYVANSGGENISVVDLTQNKQTGLIRFPPLPFNSNIALITPSLIAAGLQGPQVVMSDGSLWRVVGNQVLPRTLNTAVFGTAKTLAGPSQTMAATPGGEYIFLLAGTGTGYLYDASVDDWVAERSLFTTNANTSSLPAIQGYFGPIAAGPQGQYFLANGIIYNASLTQIGAVPTPAQVGVVTGGTTAPARGATTSATTTPTPIAGVAAVGANTFIRFSQSTATTTTTAIPAGFAGFGGGGAGGAGGAGGGVLTFPGAGGAGGAGGGAGGGGGAGAAATGGSIQPPITGPTIEVVDVATGNTMMTGIALEGPLAKVTGTQTQRIHGRTIAMDPSGTTAYALTTSGLSIVPMTPVLPSQRPTVNPNGVVSTANYLTGVAPGSLVSIFGSNMASPATAASGQLPIVMGGSCVTLNNEPMPLIVTADTQVNVQMPVDIAAGTYPLYVRSIDRLAASLAAVVKVAKTAPAVFTDGSGNAAIYHADGSLVTKSKPAVRDEKLSLLATGLGVTKGGKVTSGAPAPSSPLATTDSVQVFFGNPSISQSQLIVTWSGLVPGMIGLNQINLTVPGNHIKGNSLPVTLKIDGVTSPNTGPAPPVTWAN